MSNITRTSLTENPLKSPPAKTGVSGAVTLSDVAAHAGVGKMSVSVVLNGAKSGTRVSDATRARILQAAKELGYHPNPNAQRLAGAFLRNRVDVFTPAIFQGNCLNNIHAIQWRLNHQGFDVQLHALPWGGAEQENHGVLVQQMRHHRPQAIVCYAGWQFQERALEELAAYQAEGGIVVCLSDGSPVALECDQIIYDEEAGSYLAACHLIGNGHRDLGLVEHGAENPGNPGHPHLKGLQRALQEHGIPFQPKWQFHPGIFEAGGAVMAEWLLSMEERPTGLLFNNDCSAASFITTLWRKGCCVPEFVSVVGYNDASIAQYALVPLTTITYSSDILADEIVRVLMERIEGKYDGPPRQTFITGELVSRDSVAPLISSS